MVSIISLLCIVKFCSTLNFASNSAMYALVVQDKGIDGVWAGFVFGAWAVFFMLAALSSRVLQKIGNERAINIAFACQTLGLCVMTVATYLDDQNLFLALSFGAMIVAGFGSGTSYTMSLSIIYERSPKADKEKNIGQVELFYGIGLLTGPVWASLMITLGGYTLAYASVTIVFFMTSPYIIYQMRQ